MRYPPALLTDHGNRLPVKGHLASDPDTRKSLVGATWKEICQNLPRLIMRLRVCVWWETIQCLLIVLIEAN